MQVRLILPTARQPTRAAIRGILGPMIRQLIDPSNKQFESKLDQHAGTGEGRTGVRGVLRQPDREVPFADCPKDAARTGCGKPARPVRRGTAHRQPGRPNLYSTGPRCAARWRKRPRPGTGERDTITPGMRIRRRPGSRILLLIELRPEVEPVVRRRVAVEGEVGPVAGLEAVVGPREVDRRRPAAHAQGGAGDPHFHLVAPHGERHVAADGVPCAPATDVPLQRRAIVVDPVRLKAKS